MTQPKSQEMQQAENLVEFVERSGEVENRADASAPHVSQTTLKKGDAFLIVDEYGDFLPARKEMGLFWHGTRFLHLCNLAFNRHALILLSRHVVDGGNIVHLDFMNAAFTTPEGEHIEQGEIHIGRTLELQQDQLTQFFTLTSFHNTAVPFTLSLDIDADFRDIFEVRGPQRKARGQWHQPQASNEALTLGYRGLDNIERETHITFSPPAEYQALRRPAWNLQLERGQPVEICVTIQLRSGDRKLRLTSKDAANGERLSQPLIQSDNALLNRLLDCGIHDLTMLSTLTPYGYYPYAGIPWFSCPFGRDGLLTCLEFLPWYPEVARGTLAFLAASQGKAIEPFTDEQPGRILHEFRKGEMANLREIPYIPYYGSIDVTPLFLITLEHYLRWTNDQAFLEQLWPHAQAAARWMQEYGDRDGDGFLEYQTESSQGLSNQGWKDSWDSISYSSGELAAHPIALCEVQAYAYAAYRAMSFFAARLNHSEDAAHWQQVAEELQAKFLRHFWWEEEDAFYLALDGTKRPCDVVSSNIGHCLWSGIVPEDKASRVIERLMREDMYSGWGIRTLSTQASRYNPMSYHNGSIWPHDNGIVGAGLAQYGGKHEAGQVLKGLLDSSFYYERGRLPELFCGFPQRQDYGPINYPVACSPQAWASGAPFALLGGLLGLQPDAEQGCLVLERPTLPPWLNSLELRGMHVGGRHIHLHLTRQNAETRVITGAENEAEIIVK